MTGEAFILGTTDDAEVTQSNWTELNYYRVEMISDTLADYLFKLVERNHHKYGFQKAGYGVWAKVFEKCALLVFFNEFISSFPFLQKTFPKHITHTISLIEQLDGSKTYLLLVGEMYMVCPLVKGLTQNKRQDIDKATCANSGKQKRSYSLDCNNLCYLSFFISEQGKLESLSFDVEAADDYHYQIKADQLGKLCKALGCENSESGIATALSECLKTWADPIEIASFLKNADIEYQSLHWH